MRRLYLSVAFLPHPPSLPHLSLTPPEPFHDVACFAFWTTEQVKRIIATLFTPNSLSSAHNYIHTHIAHVRTALSPTEAHSHVECESLQVVVVVVVVVGEGLAVH